MTQIEAVSFCESEQEVPAHLIEVDSQEENQAIHNEEECRFNLGYKIRYWMGIKFIRDPSGVGDWVRESNGKKLTFFNWERIRGKYACALISRSDQGTFWKEKQCDHFGGGPYTFSALCELD